MKSIDNRLLKVEQILGLDEPIVVHFTDPFGDGEDQVFYVRTGRTSSDYVEPKKGSEVHQ